MKSTDSVLRVRLSLPRHAIGPRQVARAGEIWRLFQETAVQASIQAGWPPSRYREVGTGFVVGSMTVLHHRELRSDGGVEAQTWVRDFRRGLLSRRQVQLLDSGGVVSEATQTWVHVGEQEGVLVPVRAPEDLVAAFPVHPNPGPMTRLPSWEALSPITLPDFELELWHGWMDPLGHANHPAYIDWCDEALCRALESRGEDPTALVAVAEQVRWRQAALARDRVVVRSRVLGRVEMGLVFLHELVNLEHGASHASAVTIRCLLGDRDGSRISAALCRDFESLRRLR